MQDRLNQPLDEAQLLDLIEDQLDASDAERLRRELAAQPELLARLDRMRADRAALRDAPTPALSRDLLQALEPALARPMLLAPLGPAEYRRRHARARKPRLARYALAAALLMAVFAGVWAANSGLFTVERPVSSGDHLPGNTIAHTPGVNRLDDRRLEDQPSAINGDGSTMLAQHSDDHDRVIVHHLPPLTDARVAVIESRVGVNEPMLAGVDRSDSAPQPHGAQLSAASAPLHAPFALLIETADVERAVAQLAELVKPDMSTAALVRNMTDDEFIRFGQLLAQRDASRSGQEPATASTATHVPPARAAGNTSAAHRNTPTEFAIQELANAELGKHLAGEPTCAASVEDQLRFARAGAQFTLTVPASQLAEVLMAIHLARDQASSIRTLDELEIAPVADPASALPLELVWLEQLRDVQDALQGIDLSRGDVILPIRIAERPARRR